MKTLFIKRCFTVLFIAILLITGLNVQAIREEDYPMPLEGEFGITGARSVVPVNSVEAVLRGNKMINIKFNIFVPNVTINIKDTNNTIIYTKTIAAPEYEIISLEGLEEGCYTLELSADTGYMYGTFMYVY